MQPHSPLQFGCPQEQFWGQEQHSAPAPGPPSSQVWTGSHWDTPTAAGLSLPSSTQLQWVPHILETAAAQRLGVLSPAPSHRLQHSQGPAQVAPSPSKAHSLQMESAFYSLPEALHWEMHPSHHGKQL